MYVDEDFFKLTNELRVEVERNTGKKVHNPDITRDIAMFLESEKLVPLMKRRAQSKRRYFL